MSRSSTARIWNYFEKCEDSSKTAICHYCSKSLSYKTTITNLKVHLRQKHPLVYNDLLKASESPTELSELLNNDDSNQSAAAPDVWSFFEQETGGRARCVVCRATLPHRTRDLRLHLKDNHPKLAQDFVEMSENEDEQKDTYTEVVYLEDESRKTIKREQQQHTRKRASYQPAAVSKKPKKRKSSSSSDESLRENSADDNDEQLEKFGTYITCLLKKMPRDVCIKLQMDVINLIMTTKLKLQSEAAESKVIIDGVPVAIQTVSGIPGTGFLVTVPGGECKQPAPGDVKVDPLVQDSREQPKLLANPLPKDISYAIVE